jgi:hypothetical protein
MKPTKRIAEWRHIFLDTSTIIDYLSDATRQEKNPPVKRRIELTQQVINGLRDNALKGDDARNRKRIFYISAITIVELRKIASNDIALDLVRMFEFAEVEFVEFSQTTALSLNRALQNYLPDGQKHQFIKFMEEEWREKGVANIRQWVADDLKICGTAKSLKKLDVVLTGDHKTFKVIADKFDLPCLAMQDEDLPKDLFGDLAI